MERRGVRSPGISQRQGGLSFLFRVRRLGPALFSSRVIMKRFPFFLLGAALLGAISVSLTGCSARRAEASSGTDAPTVTVSHPIEREVTDYQEYTGRTAAVDSV